MLVRAKEACFIDGHRRRAGAEFDYAGEVLPPCLVAVKNSAAPQTEVKTEPMALSELAMGEGKPKSFIDAVSKKSKHGSDK